MNINKIYSQNIYSLRQAININVLRESMNQGDNMLTLIGDMSNTIEDTKVASHPYKGAKIDTYI